MIGEKLDLGSRKLWVINCWWNYGWVWVVYVLDENE